MNNRTFWILAGLLLAFFLASCGPSQAEINATDTQVARDVFATQTAAAPPPTATPTDTPTPEPTSTPTPTDTPAPTDTPTSTSTPTLDLTATAAYEATQAMGVLLEEIDAELQTVNLSTERGRLAWLGSGPTSITLDTYGTHWWIPLGEDVYYSDFVLRADVTWESTSGLATCGFWIRGESTDEDAEHYAFEALRLSGLPAWIVGYWKDNLPIGGNPHTSRAIHQELGSTNQYLFVAEGNELAIYVNGESLGKVTISKLREGIIAFYASQESGKTTCTFDNVWVWDLSE